MIDIPLDEERCRAGYQTDEYALEYERQGDEPVRRADVPHYGDLVMSCEHAYLYCIDNDNVDIKTIMLQTKAIEELLIQLKRFKILVAKSEMPSKILLDMVRKINEGVANARLANNLSTNDYWVKRQLVRILEDEASQVGDETNANRAFNIVKKDFDNRVADLKKQSEDAKKLLSNMFLFSEEVFTEGQELLVIVTELTTNVLSARFISRYGCDEYFKHNKELLFYERNLEIEQAIDELGL